MTLSSADSIRAFNMIASASSLSSPVEEPSAPVKEPSAPIKSKELFSEKFTYYKSILSTLEGYGPVTGFVANLKRIFFIAWNALFSIAGKSTWQVGLKKLSAEIMKFEKVELVESKDKLIAKVNDAMKNVINANATALGYSAIDPDFMKMGDEAFTVKFEDIKVAVDKEKNAQYKLKDFDSAKYVKPLTENKFVNSNTANAYANIVKADEAFEEAREQFEEAKAKAEAEVKVKAESESEEG